MCLCDQLDYCIDLYCVRVCVCPYQLDDVGDAVPVSQFDVFSSIYQALIALQDINVNTLEVPVDTLKVCVDTLEVCVVDQTMALLYKSSAKNLWKSALERNNNI